MIGPNRTPALAPLLGSTIQPHVWLNQSPKAANDKLLEDLANRKEREDYPWQNSQEHQDSLNINNEQFDIEKVHIDSHLEDLLKDSPVRNHAAKF